MRILALSLLALAITGTSTPSQEQGTAHDEKWFKPMKYRMIGPTRGGRSAAVCGVPGKPMLFYFGATGGGVWRTNDGGASWENISDGHFGGSIGAVAVSEADPNVIYVGGGEVTVRGNVSHGEGVWKSVDAGKTWKQMGLRDTRHIPRIRVHPRNPELIYVAALGHLYGPSDERGIFRSEDGGKTWKKILFANNEAGAVDLILDPGNPRVLYASTWRVKRTPYSLESGGEGSGLWKSTDGGDTWKEITRNKGLPGGTVGIIGVAVSPVDSRRVWAIVEATDGGVFRSDDAGETWQRVNEDRDLRQRAWYYSRIYAGPKNVDEVYVLNVEFWRSGDGGKTFKSFSTPHVDHHDLWIDPGEPERMVVADDGGAQVSFNRGKTWSTYMNQPTAQFYRVTTDSHFPYRIYGAQQDNSTIRILHTSGGRPDDDRDWEPTAGGESGHLAVNPKDPEIVYGGSYAGYLTRVNHRTKEVRNVTVWPDNPIGHGAEDLAYRFQWNFPIFFSPHDPDKLYAAGNVLFETTNEGQTWKAISPDLTRNDKSKLGPSGGPITKDNTTVEYYCTIFAAIESPHEKGVLWCGSDDGLVHLSRDGGKTWANVTPGDLPEWTLINSLEPHPTIPGGLYLAGTRYKLDDFRPYLYLTTDYGKTWKKIVKGIADDHFTRVIRADPGRAGLLYAGTEQGMYISFDDGVNWQRFQLNLPVVPITDLVVKEKDLVVATQGRSFWVLDDLTLLHQVAPEKMKEPARLFKPRATHRLRGASVRIRYHLAEKPSKEKPVVLEIKELDGKSIRRFSTEPKKGEDKLDADQGMNELRWNLRYPSAEGFPGLIMWAGSLSGPRAVPGTYKAELTLGQQTQGVEFEVLADPRASASQEDYQAQFDFILGVRDKLTQTHQSISRLRDIRTQIEELKKRMKDREEYRELVKQMEEYASKLTKIEETLYQTKNQSPQDPLNFPVRLNNKLASLASTADMGDYRPTDQVVHLRKEIEEQIDGELTKLNYLFDEELPRLNKAIGQRNVPRIFSPPDGK